MMIVSTTTIANLIDSGRWDVAFNALRDEYKELAGTLGQTLTEEQLAKLATDLPFEPVTAGLIWARARNYKINKDSLSKIVSPPTPDAHVFHIKRYRKDHVALYCAAAAQYGLSKALTEIHELTKKKLEMVKTIQAVVDLASSPGLEALLKSLKRSTETDAKDRAAKTAQTESVRPLPVARQESPEEAQVRLLHEEEPDSSVERTSQGRRNELPPDGPIAPAPR